jgi:hypothetical protein
MQREPRPRRSSFRRAAVLVDVVRRAGSRRECNRIRAVLTAGHTMP